MRFLRRLAVPASESQIGLALGMALVIMALLLCALLWQSSIISHQRDMIRWLWNSRASAL